MLDHLPKFIGVAFGIYGGGAKIVRYSLTLVSVSI